MKACTIYARAAKRFSNNRDILSVRLGAPWYIPKRRIRMPVAVGPAVVTPREHRRSLRTLGPEDTGHIDMRRRKPVLLLIAEFCGVPDPPGRSGSLWVLKSSLKK